MKSIFSILVMLCFFNTASAQSFWYNASPVRGHTDYVTPGSNGIATSADHIQIYNSTNNYEIFFRIRNSNSVKNYRIGPGESAPHSLGFYSGEVLKTVIIFGDNRSFRLEGRSRYKLYYVNGRVEISKY